MNHSGRLLMMTAVHCPPAPLYNRETNIVRNRWLTEQHFHLTKVYMKAAGQLNELLL